MSDSPTDLNGEGLDCAIRVGQLEDSALIARKIGYLRNGVCASPEYLRKYGAPRSIEDLDQHDCIVSVRANGVHEPWPLRDGGLYTPAKPHLLMVDELEDRLLWQRVLLATADALPTPVPRKRAAKQTAARASR